MISVVTHALMITGFVFGMMLVVEYLNVLTQGAWQSALTRSRWGQYLLAAVLGGIPGCLGAFAVVAMYSHGILTLGAIVTAMIATSGDEAFVMLAMIPKDALLLFAVLFAVGILAGLLTDGIFGRKRSKAGADAHVIETHDEFECVCFPRGKIVEQWRRCSAHRGILATVLMLFALAIVFGWVMPEARTWVRVTAFLLSTVALFIVATVPEHFLDEHLWEHVARKHVPRIFLWTLGALILMYFISEHLEIEETIRHGKWVLLPVVCLVGLIPESGPHLIVVTLYASGTLPMSILLASSVVQDGHGMLPMLAHSRREFVMIKAINFVIGLTIGGIALGAGF